MKNINKILQAIFATALILNATSCDSDLTKVYVLPVSEITLYGGSEDIILNSDNQDALALSLYWDTDNTLETSDPTVQAPIDFAELSIQISGLEDFESLIEVPVNKGETSKQFLCGELNAILSRLNFSSETMNPCYIRLKSVLADNLSPNYSNAVSLNIKPFRLRMNIGKVLAADKSETEMILASPEENGIYTGFMGVPAWYNWWFLEADNTLWGNDGDSGLPFEASTNESHWNFWFPEDAGCFFVTLDTKEKNWSALHIDNLYVEGDLSGSMEYNQKANVWTLNVDKPAGDYVISISGEGALYNTTTDTYRAGAIPKEIAFISDNGSLQLLFGKPSSINISLPGGQTSLVLDLNNPIEFILTTGEAPESPEIYEEVLWMSGFDDGISGKWNFDCYLTSYDQEQGKYAAVHIADSLWGWLLYTDNNWGGTMGTDSTDPNQGKILDGGNNIPSPAPGKYLVDVDLSEKTYTLTEVSDIWYTGLNDDWDLYPMTLVEGCIYEAEVQKKAETPWGVKILLRDDWSVWFGGADGVLRLGWDGFNGDNELPTGTYILQVDLSKCTYSYKEK